jgi:hypothetical protein
MYEHVKKSCMRSKGPGHKKVCAKIAAATVNKYRATHGESLTRGCHCPRGSRPLVSDKKRCYDAHSHKRLLRLCPRGSR